MDEFTETYLNDRNAAQELLNGYDKLDAIYAVAIAMSELEPSERHQFFKFIESITA